MTYTKTTWTNSTGQPISAANLNKIEQGVADGSPVDTVANLKSITGALHGETRQLLGYYAAGRGGGVVRRNTSLSTFNEGTTFDMAGAAAAEAGGWERIPTGPVKVEDFGAKVNDDTFSNTAVVQAAHDYVKALGTGGDVEFPQTGSLQFLTGLNWDLGYVGIIGHGATCKTIGMASGAYLFTIKSTYSSDGGDHLQNVVGKIRLQGDGYTWGQRAVLMADFTATAAAAQQVLSHFNIQFFAKAVVMDDYSWVNTLEDCEIGWCGVAFEALTAAGGGEKYSLVNCTIHNCLTFFSIADCEVNLVNCALDFPTNTMAELFSGAHLDLIGCHVEGTTDQTSLVFDIWDHSQLTMLGGEIIYGPNGAAPTAIPAIIRVTGTPGVGKSAYFRHVNFRGLTTTSGKFVDEATGLAGYVSIEDCFYYQSTNTVTFASGKVATVQALSNSSTIAVGTKAQEIFPVSETANVASIVLASGLYDGQVIQVVNRSAFTVTFNTTQATSHMAESAVTIPSTRAFSFVWDANYGGTGTGRWVRLSS